LSECRAGHCPSQCEEKHEHSTSTHALTDGR
jgi:hypothetical protein